MLHIYVCTVWILRGAVCMYEYTHPSLYDPPYVYSLHLTGRGVPSIYVHRVRLTGRVCLECAGVSQLYDPDWRGPMLPLITLGIPQCTARHILQCMYRTSQGTVCLCALTPPCMTRHILQYTSHKGYTIVYDTGTYLTRRVSYRARPSL